MIEPEKIAEFLQQRLRQLNLDEVTAVDAAQWLAAAGLLADYADRPGLPLRRLLRDGRIAYGEQRPPTSNGRWFIVRRAADDRHANPSADDTTRTNDPTRAGMPRSHSMADKPSTRHGSEASANNHEQTDDHPPEFTRTALVARGFEGFVRFKGVDLMDVPKGPGVYIVLRETDTRPAFLQTSPAGWFKGRDPTVPVSELDAAWPEGAHCVYIGKADSGETGSRGLRKRIQEFRRFADGAAVGHQGGRRIWQLVDADDYVLTWLEMPNGDPGALEAELLQEFVRVYRKLPFGNRNAGRS